MNRTRLCSFALIAATLTPFVASAGGETGKVEIRVVERGQDSPVSCRIHLKDAAGKPHWPEGLPFWRDHFVCGGSVQLELPVGKYTYEIDRGPEYQIRAGTITVTNEGTAKVEVGMERLVDMAAEGWWSGDLHVHRPLDDIELLMRAEDLYVAPVITWWNNRNLWANRELPSKLLTSFDKNRFYHAMSGEDEREGGALLYFHLDRPMVISPASREFPSPMQFLTEARRHRGVWVDIEKPFWWDVPIWLASGQVDSIGLANNHMCRDQMYETEAWGKPRDTERLPAPRGNGYWSQKIYYHILNCGLRIPPSAGSASGVLPNPVGYNRVYTYPSSEMNYESWWAALRDGRSFVTNGPLLRVRANDELPGTVFSGPAGKQLVLNIQAKLTGRDPMSSVEIIKNGKVERLVSFEDWTKTGNLGSLTFDASGWFLVRAIAENPKTFRFASTAPFYVEVGETRRRVSRSSAQFFLDWVNERAGRVKLDDVQQREEVLRHHDMARQYWQRVVDGATAN